ncbi:MAG: hypothetical protein IPN91_03565 [Holophagaceae bacterium]|uniref:Uncharacterized protein n=1 Tax=Candidatus Geothrix odensensis TaxID=2954440 RepID=A0A936F038_9BACT|nr:hypothetical protein [Candidatus Geothrix odensensis]
MRKILNAKSKAGVEKRPTSSSANSSALSSGVKNQAKKQEEFKAELHRAQLRLSPVTSAAVTSSVYLDALGKVDFCALLDTLEESTGAFIEGITEVESMLIGQAFSLQAIFMKLADRASRTTLVKHIEVDLRLALKAQAQCCRTLEVLAGIKNPPVVLARQANITSGPNRSTTIPALQPLGPVRGS